jgi:alkanesulfonate monooxygenase SsuD/methylene tetrahydromethanopterin reductase-like flavin-dependent oxidoreductase (luciferase family)
MRLGINLPFLSETRDAPSAADIGKRARAIEAIGFQGIWVGDVFSRGLVWPDPLMWLLAAGAATERVELGTSVFQVPLRNPVELAQRFLTLQALTKGRFLAGVGAGSTQGDFDAAGVDFEARFRTLRESLSIIKRLCNGEQVGAANLHPWPSTVGGPPIIIGSWWNGPWIKRAAQEFDGWISSAGRTNFNTLREGIKRYRDLGGKRALVTSIYIDLNAPDKPIRDDEQYTLSCGPEQAVERLGRLADLGYDDAILVKHASVTEGEMTEETIQQIWDTLKPVTNR